MKQFILHLNDKSQFVIDDLDETHLLVEETSVDMIQREIATLMEKNVYTPAIERGQGWRVGPKIPKEIPSDPQSAFKAE